MGETNSPWPPLMQRACIVRSSPLQFSEHRPHQFDFLVYGSASTCVRAFPKNGPWIKKSNSAPGNFHYVSRSIFGSFFFFYSSLLHFFFTLIIPKISPYIVSKVHKWIMPLCVNRISDQEGFNIMAHKVTNFFAAFSMYFKGTKKWLFKNKM